MRRRKNRSRSKISRLPSEIRSTVDAMIQATADFTYKDIQAYLAEQNVDVSQSAIGTYARNLMESLEALNMAQESIRAMMDTASKIPEVDAAIGVGDLESIVDAVKAAYDRGCDKTKPVYRCITKAENQVLGGDRVITTPEYSVYLKISEGCDNHCTYCAIPAIRGKFRSRPVEDLVKEAAELADLGARELIVVSQDSTSYGKDIYGKPSLDVLLTELCKIDKLKWIRIL